jgi:hypothetical protein
LLRLFLAASIFGAVLGQPRILCVEADGRNHTESLLEVCCLQGSPSAPGGPSEGLQAIDSTTCGDCRDVFIAGTLRSRPVERGTPVAPAASPIARPVALAPILSTAFPFLDTGQRCFVSPVLLALRTIVLSC